MKKLILSLIIGILLINSVSAFLNTKNEIEFGEGISKYGKIEIKDWWGLSKRTELELKENTEVCPTTGCYAKKEITMYQDGILIDDIRFIKLFGSHKVDYTIRYKTDGEWIEYNLGDEVEGNGDGTIYEVELRGILNGFSSVDWQIKSQGFWIEEWAVWTSALNTGLVAYWNFDETAGNFTDAVRGIHNGSILEGVSYDTGLINNGINFDADEYANISDSADWDVANFSIVTWVKTDGVQAGANGFIFNRHSEDSGNNIFILLNNNNTVSFRTIIDGDDIIYSNGPIPADTWVQIIATYNGSDMELYINGTKQTQVGSQTGTIVSTRRILFGNNVIKDTDYNGMMDETGFWNRTLTSTEVTNLYNAGGGISYLAHTEVTLDSPASGSSYLRSANVEFNATSTPATGNLTNATLFIWDSDSNLINETTNILSGNVANQTSFNVNLTTIGDLDWNVYSCYNQTTPSCTFAAANWSVTINAFTEGTHTFNSTAFETESETFRLNITTDGSQTVSGNLIYNGTSFTGVKSGTNAEAILTKQLNIPTITNPGKHEFYWEVTVGSSLVNSTFQNQTVNFTQLDLCNATLSVPYINITFKNETEIQETINATISSTWTYYLGDGSVNKTLSFSNTTENLNYQFCASPPSRALNTFLTMSYNNQESQQRTFTSTSLLSNITTTKILYLLPTGLGLFSQFRVEDFLGNVLSGTKAVISRTIGGESINLESSFTDSSGLVIFFLNPDKVYNGLFTLSGFEDNNFTFVPTTEVRIVTMGSISGAVTNGTEVTLNTTYLITPTNSSLINNTDYTFTLEVTSSQSINLITMNITNSSGSQLLFDSDTSTGTLSGVINTANHTRIIGTYTIGTSEETLTITRLWIVGTEFEGDYSLFRQLKFFNEYGFKDFWKFLIVLITIIGMLVFMSAGEITETSESKIIVALLMVWGFSLIGWLDNPAIVSETGLALFSRQYGIAILSTVGGLYFILRRLFIRRI